MKQNFLIIKSLKISFLKYGFFTRKGGFSKNKFSSLNCSFSNNDNKINVKRNINLALKTIGLSNKKVKFINQTHSNKIINVNLRNFNKKHYADGIVTSTNKIALALLTADCAPIFIFDKNKKKICCLHSGWKGTLKNIVKKSIMIFKKNNIKNKDIIVIIGPCLSKTNFEVEKTFKEKFLVKNQHYSKFFKSKNSKKDLFDMRGMINYQFSELGVKNIHNINKNTYSNNTMFFSHRRATFKKEFSTGRMINIISFE